jgi:hypothetical protein
VLKICALQNNEMRQTERVDMSRLKRSRCSRQLAMQLARASDFSAEIFSHYASCSGAAMNAAYHRQSDAARERLRMFQKTFECAQTAIDFARRRRRAPY